MTPLRPLTMTTDNIAAFAGYSSAAQWRAAAHRLGVRPIDPQARPQRWSVAEVQRALDRTAVNPQNEPFDEEALNDRLLGLT